jgi:hypothetical protein
MKKVIFAFAVFFFPLVLSAQHPAPMPCTRLTLKSTRCLTRIARLKDQIAYMQAAVEFDGKSVQALLDEDSASWKADKTHLDAATAQKLENDKNLLAADTLALDTMKELYAVLTE